MAAVLDRLEQQYGRDMTDELRARLQQLFADSDQETVQTLRQIAQIEDPASAIRKFLELIENIEDERIVKQRIDDPRPNRSPRDLFQALNSVRLNGDD